MKMMKFLIIPLLIVMLLAFGMNSFASLHSKWSSGDLIFYDGATDIFTIKDSTDGLMVHDDINLTFGDDSDATIIYDETTDNVLEITCSNGIALSGAMAITGNITVSNAAGPVMVDEAATKSNPTLCPNRAEIDTGLGWQSDALYFALGGVEEYSFTTATFEMNANTITEAGKITANDAAGFAIIDEPVTVTNPTICPNKTEEDTGLGWEADTIHIVLGGADEYDFSTTTLEMNSNTITEAGTITVTDAAGPAILNEAVTATNPTLCPNRADETLGIGWATNVIHLVVGGASEVSLSATTLDMNANTITDVGDIETTNAAGPTLQNEAATGTNPTLIPNRAEEDTGIGWQSDVLHVVLGGVDEYSLSTSTFDMNSNTITEAGTITATNAAGPTVINLAATNTVPTLCPNRAETDTGLGWQSDVLHVVLGGVDEYSFSTATLDMNSNTLTEVGGIVVDDDATVAFGTGSDITESWNNTRGALITTPAGHFVSPEGISDRFRLTWVAGQRGKPAANGDIQNSAEGTRMIADPDFEVLGTGAGAISVSHYAEGGISLVTDGTVDHGLVLLPHLTANTTAWKEVTWGTDKETRWECSIKTGPAITTCIIWAGLKLTNTPTTITDADQVFFRYEDDIIAGNWQAVNSIGDSDDAHDSGVAVAINTVYHLVIEIAADRTAKFYINGTLVETSAALTDAVDLIPYIGIEEDGASAAMTLYVRGQAISRKFE